MADNDKIQEIIDTLKSLAFIEKSGCNNPGKVGEALDKITKDLEAEVSKPCPVFSIKPEKCKWTRAFDQHFNISCKTGERANGNFRGKEMGSKWEFNYCPYCGREIEET